jgi:hypothetical protein
LIADTTHTDLVDDVVVNFSSEVSHCLCLVIGWASATVVALCAVFGVQLSHLLGSLQLKKTELVGTFVAIFVIAEIVDIVTSHSDCVCLDRAFDCAEAEFDNGCVVAVLFVSRLKYVQEFTRLRELRLPIASRFDSLL